MIPNHYSKGLHQVGTGTHAYLQPDGDWGMSNAGLVADCGQTLLVDTLFDLNLTSEMLAAMAAAVPCARKIDILVNSHADGDHTFGNQLVAGARIVASEATAREFFKTTPQSLHRIVTHGASEGERYIAEKMGGPLFDFSRISLTPPTETYEREMLIKVGDKDVRLVNVGPAHTAGDTLVYSVQDRVVFTGDLLFLGVHPAIWAGSLDGWLAACDSILEAEVDVVVPGHGPVTDKAGVRLFRDYLVLIRDETRKRYDAGLSVEEAALDLALGPRFDDWLSPERMVGTVNFLYRQFGSQHTMRDFVGVFAALSRYVKAKEMQRCAQGQHSSTCTHA